MRNRNRALLTSAVSLALAAGLTTPVFADSRQCLDEHCFLQSLPSLDRLLVQPEGLEGAGVGGTSSTAAQSVGTWGFDLSGMDLSVAPGDDFFRYANGKAVDRMVIAADRTSNGTFLMLRNLSETRMKAIVDDLSTKTNLTGDEAKIAALYGSMMDQATRNQRDVAPLAKELGTIRALKTKSELATHMGRSAGGFGGSFFGPAVWEDQKAPQSNALYLFQGGLSLPDRDYYLEEKFAAKKALYEAYVTDMLRMVGYPDAAKAARDIVAMETEIARVSWTRVDSRNDDLTYNPYTPKALADYAPGFDWQGFFKGARLDTAKVIVAQNTAFPKIAKIFADTPLETLKAWQTFKTVDEASPYLSDRFSMRQWEFRSRDLSGTQSQSPLWQRSITVTEKLMGEALGRTYVAQYFPEESKASMQVLVDNLKIAMARRIDGLTWMSAETRAKAQEKLSKFNVKIGYPDQWKDYAALEIRKDDLFGNVERGLVFLWDESVDKLGKPVDPKEWGMTPQTVNAYYSPTRNEIVFPAAILQPPFFDVKADPAVNYGGIGGVIGHEITHGFDDQGRKADGDGYLRDWWLPEDAARFEAEAAKYGAQYDTYEPIPGAKVQSKLSMGENIADLGGILLGLEGYRLSHPDAPVLDGFTGDQRVFLGWAQIWSSKFTDEALRQRVVTGPHAPNMFRVIGPLRNVDDWYKAFGITSGKYYLPPEDRVKIW